MKYIELRVHASRQGIEQLTALFMKRGIVQVSIDDPADMEDILSKKNQYGWDYVEDSLKENLDREPTISVFLQDTEEDRNLIQELKIDIMKLKNDELDGIYGEDANLGRLYAETLESDDEDWKDKWKEFFKPSRITDRIVVKPTWEEYQPEERELVLEIDPGMAFGTGTHETTSLCMKALERYLGDAADGKCVLDVGCGSGILSIAAALLGCSQVLGVEIDQDAVRVAKENVELNGVSDAVSIRQGDLTKGIDYKCDIAVANLMSELVIMMSKDISNHIKEGGLFISSGILIEQRDRVIDGIKSDGFEIVDVQEDGEWCAVIARK